MLAPGQRGGTRSVPNKGYLGPEPPREVEAIIRGIHASAERLSAGKCVYLMTNHKDCGRKEQPCGQLLQGLR